MKVGIDWTAEKFGFLLAQPVALHETVVQTYVTLQKIQADKEAQRRELPPIGIVFAGHNPTPERLRLQGENVSMLTHIAIIVAFGLGNLYPWACILLRKQTDRRGHRIARLQ